MPGHDIIVIGASAGGVSAIRKLAQILPRDLPAAVFVVLHIPADSPSLLPKILMHAGALPAVHAMDGMAIEKGCIYVAPPDRHVIVEHGSISVVRGPRENRHRPAIDPLFRSAALAYGPRVIGVVLTGALDDGTAGLLAIKRRGGLAVVQDPKEALYRSMPESALHHVQVDYSVTLAEMGPLLVRLSRQKAAEEAAYPIYEDLRKEVGISKMEREVLKERDNAGTPSEFSCPECGGVLWEIQDGKLQRFRCRVGHAFTAESVQAAQQDKLEEALWTALKTLEEQVSLSRRMLQHATQNGHDWLARTFEQRMLDAEQRANTIRDALIEQKEPQFVDETEVSEQSG